jgi:hypothetical protein
MCLTIKIKETKRGPKILVGLIQFKLENHLVFRS